MVKTRRSEGGREEGREELSSSIEAQRQSAGNFQVFLSSSYHLDEDPTKTQDEGGKVR